jgi:hypothetical protein
MSANPGMMRIVEGYEFEAEIWQSESTGSWAFVTVPGEDSDDIRFRSGPPVGFGSVRVEVTVGGSTWRTSVFPDAKSGCYVMPFKQAVRRAEGLDVGDVADVSLRALDS